MAVSKVVFGNNTIMDITDSTITADKVLEGEIAYAADGSRIVGTASGGGGGGGGVDETLVTYNVNGTLKMPPYIGIAASDSGLFYGANNFNYPVRFGNHACFALYRAFELCNSLNSEIIIDEPDWEWFQTQSANEIRKFTFPNKGVEVNLLFNSCKNFNRPFELRPWMRNPVAVFQGCSIYNYPVNIPDPISNSYINTIGFGVPCASMFSGAWAFNSRVNFPRNNVIGNIGVQSMFQSTNLFNQPIYIKCANGRIFLDSMFQHAQNFRDMILIDFTNETGLITMNTMFNNAKARATDIILNYTNTTAMIVRGVNICRNYYKYENKRINIYVKDPALFTALAWENYGAASTSYFAATTNGYYNASMNVYILTNVSDGVNKFWDHYNTLYGIT